MAEVVSENQFGLWLSEQIKANGYTQRETAELLSVSESFLGRVLNGTRHPSSDLTDRASIVFSADAAWLREMAGLPPIEFAPPGKPIVFQAIRILNRLSSSNLRIAIRILEAFANESGVTDSSDVDNSSPTSPKKTR